MTTVKDMKEKNTKIRDQIVDRLTKSPATFATLAQDLAMIGHAANGAIVRGGLQRKLELQKVLRALDRSLQRLRKIGRIVFEDRIWKLNGDTRSADALPSSSYSTDAGHCES